MFQLPGMRHVAPLRRKTVRRPDFTALHRHLLWVCLVLATAAYLAVCVQNITEVLTGITRQHQSVEAVDSPRFAPGGNGFTR